MFSFACLKRFDSMKLFLFSGKSSAGFNAASSIGNADLEVSLSTNRRATSLDLPMAMRFRHLAKNAKEAVGVYRYTRLDYSKCLVK